MDKSDEGLELLKGQAEIWKNMFSFADSMALKCAVELRIADIIHSHGHPLTLSEIASSITNSSTQNLSYLARIMRLLVRNKIFTASEIPNPPENGGGDPSSTTLYGLTAASRWLLHQNEEHLGLSPFVLMENHPWFLSPWHQLGTCVRDGGIAFQKAHGKEIWDLASQNPEFNKIFNDGMECTAKITIKAILSGFKDAKWDSLESLVDVGGGTGATIAEIVKVYPHIKGINFDLPHVVATAPKYNGVSHVGGDMFEAIPNAQAVFMKWITHDWGDEDCVKILKNCRRAIPEKTGKIFIVDVVLKPDGNGLFDRIALILDLVMIAHSSGGKERTESEWKMLLEKGGFPRYNITEIPAFLSIIEAYPK